MKSGKQNPKDKLKFENFAYEIEIY